MVLFLAQRVFARLSGFLLFTKTSGAKFIFAIICLVFYLHFIVVTPIQEVAHTQLQQDGSETKQDEINGQNIPGTQELFITLQVPAGLQHVQPQLLTDPSFALQQVQLVQQVAAQESQQVPCSDNRLSACEHYKQASEKTSCVKVLLTACSTVHERNEM